uniref:Leucine-rich repeat-containing N-terminal plant-type domain-containing protein n=1 Tax=Aegilops tauschii subsp. strangulata TaxID=200361 RepID=A0A453G8Z6_AEGTS
PVRADIRREAEALVKWKASLDGADESLGPWSLANSTSLCNWTHITCDSAGHIRSLDLTIVSLNGTLDQLDFSAFPHLGKLTLFHAGFTANNMVADLRDCFQEHLGQLETMAFSQNHLYGTLLTDQGEVFLCNYTALKLLDLSNNALHGGLSKCFWDFPSLAFMDLSSNSFSGVVPISRTCADNLKYLHLAENHFRGTFPLGLKKCKNLITLDLGGNHFSGTIPSWGIDLSGNSLSQEIPGGLTTLLGLRYLNLSGNHLSGCIPEDIGNLVLLESLDLSQNQLSGEIPPSFAALKAMSALNLSTNDLSGRIPTGSQLQTLVDPSIYSNNPGLCGFPLKDCVNSSDTDAK